MLHMDLEDHRNTCTCGDRVHEINIFEEDVKNIIKFENDILENIAAEENLETARQSSEGDIRTSNVGCEPDSFISRVILSCL